MSNRANAVAEEDLPKLPTAAAHLSHWYVRVNLLGALVYVTLVGWLLLASAASLVIQIDDDALDWRPLTGIGLAVIGLVAIHFGTEHDPGT